MEDEKPHILIVDDDNRIRRLLKRYLNDNGFAASLAKDAAEAQRMVAALEFDVLIVDVMMPGQSGFELTEQLKKKSHIPIILLTARGQPEDRIKGLELGADDYLAKPFEPKELVLRIQSILRHRSISQPRGREFTFGDFSFNAYRGELRRDGDVIRLTAGELTLLRALVQKPGEPVARYLLVDGQAAATDRAVDVHVTRLRKKIEDDPQLPLYLQTVRGVGYALMTD